MKKSWKGCGRESNGRLPGSGVGILCWRQLLLSHFSRVWLCATPQTTAHQVPLSPGFSRQEYWRGLPFPSPVHESEKWKWSCSVMCLTPSNPMDCSPPGSSIHGIFQARVLEWVAIAFSKNIILHYIFHLVLSYNALIRKIKIKDNFDQWIIRTWNTAPYKIFLISHTTVLC